MHFMYVDESGDPGSFDPNLPRHTQPSQHYVLTGFIIRSEDWRNYLSAMVDIRRFIKSKYGLPVRVELHGSELIHPRGNNHYKSVGSRKKRVGLYKDVLESVVGRMPAAKVININLDKRKPKYDSTVSSKDIELLAWDRLIQRFNRYLKISCDGELGLIFADETNERKIRSLLRRMRVYNMVPSRFGNAYSDPIEYIVEDPVVRKSEHSYFVQVADLTSHALYHRLYPKGGLRRFNVDRLFDAVEPILLREASRDDPYGIVHL